VATLEIDAVALSVTMPPPPAQARALVDAYADASRGAVWLVGGQGISPEMRRHIEARGGIVGDTAFPEIRRALDKAVRREHTTTPSSEPDGHEPSTDVGEHRIS
jgi:hypothetical protein